jgi:protoheme ferro-lyase
MFQTGPGYTVRPFLNNKNPQIHKILAKLRQKAVSTMVPFIIKSHVSTQTGKSKDWFSTSINFVPKGSLENVW